MEIQEMTGHLRRSEVDWSPKPARARLGRFEDVYSPQHLDRSPALHRNFAFCESRDEGTNIDTPGKTPPIDRCRTGRPVRTRPARLADLQNSFEGNQSYPGLTHHLKPPKMELETPPKVKSSADLVRVDGPNGLRFNSSLASVAASGEPSPLPGPTPVDRFPNKAVFTIEPNSLKILIVNSEACSLLGYSSSELCSMTLSDLLRDKRSDQLSFPEPSGEGSSIVLLSGKVVELQSCEGVRVVVSLWIRQLESEGPCLVVAEPVNYRQIVLTVNGESGLVVSCSGDEAAALFQAESGEKLVGLPVTSLIPSVALPPADRARVPRHLAKQKATGRSLDGASFPLCLWISKQSENVDSSLRSNNMKMCREKPLLDITIRVTYNVSGLLVVDEAGAITACNHHFCTLTFGKKHSEVIGRPVGDIVPNFCRPADLVRAPQRTRQATLSPVNNDNDRSGSDTDQDSCGAFNGSQKSACTSLNVLPSQASQLTRDKSSSALCLDKSSSVVTHTPTPTQDMVSSLSTTEQRNDTSTLPDGLSMSGVSADEDYLHGSISKSRSENILQSEQSSAVKLPREVEQSESEYYTSQHSQEVTPTSNVPRVRLNDPSLRLSFDSSKFRQLKPGSVKEDRNSLSLDFCDSNETSADFLTPINEMPASGCEIEELPNNNCNGSNDSLSIDMETQTESSPRTNIEECGAETPCAARRALRAQVATSTPQCRAPKQDAAGRACDPRECPVNCQHKDGTYRGVVIHKDGTELSVVYTVSGVQLAAGRVQCVWLGVRVSDERVRHTTLASSVNSTADNSLALPNRSAGSRPHSMSLASQCGEEQVSGDYNKHYATLKQIGKGAYGCVKMAYRRSDRLLVIAKFILKEKVSSQFWVDAPDKTKRIPLEVSLLLTLNHPNIVTVLDVFENERYFQMVMEKHGAGMDLFEFIERRPRLDEPLISYVFRQIGLAVEYLHSLSILHRDIKDENVIIDGRFHVKLIDFGSATFMRPDTLFSTFYGTTEYCSPEVLAGNKYAGPELEMWSMGITLYVLTFFVNPFADIEETIQGPLALPQPVSEELEHLLLWMLCKDPASRATVAQLMAHPWIQQPVAIAGYSFADVVDCEAHEASPAPHYSGSPSTCGAPPGRGRPSHPPPTPRAPSAGAAERDAHSDNCSLRSSADILDISWKPVSDALTDISSDATGHAACDIDYDAEPYDCDSWDECEQDSFS